MQQVPMRLLLATLLLTCCLVGRSQDTNTPPLPTTTTSDTMRWTQPAGGEDRDYVLTVESTTTGESLTVPTLNPITQPPTTNTPISIKLAWDPSPSTNIWLYQVKVGTVSGQYEMTQLTTNIEPRDITNSFGQISTNVVALAMTNLFLGQTNYFIVTAMNDIGVESIPSNELEVFIPSERPDPPDGLRLEMLVIPVFETSMNGIDWSRAGAGEPVILNNIADMRLVRVRLETSAVPSL